MTIIKANENQKKYLRNEYISRINRVIDYIEKNIDKDLSLKTIADVAYFSQFHFHRIFRAMVGETVNQFIQRVRVEKAASLLISNPKKSITEIAFDCGFSGSSAFARAFRETFHMSASEWRSEGHLQDRKIRETNSKESQTVGKIRKDFDVSSYYIDGEIQNQIWRIKMKEKGQIQVEVNVMPELHVAYVRHIGPYKGNSELFGKLFEKLMKWAAPRGLLRFPETKVLVVYHDDPNITDEDKLRTSACITVSEDTPVEGEVGKMTIPGGKFAVARFEIANDEFEEAWNMFMGGWLPESGYQPDDRLCYELYHNNHKEHPEKKHIVDICVPVKPL
ncbi:MAG: AraC family transcriptional regulator [Syntrophobacterales bacterium]|nr:MAG: AraC family transcriptional regulator [Syntrophobacterales bacterium]